MAPLPPLQQLGFGSSRWRLQGNATLGLRAGGRGHHLFFLPHKSPLLAQSEAASEEVRAEFKALVEQCRTALRNLADETD